MFAVLRQKAAEKHPKYRSGEWTMEETLLSFVDSLAFSPRDGEDGDVYLEDFIDYYQGLSVCIDKDEHFEKMMRLTYGLD